MKFLKCINWSGINLPRTIYMITYLFLSTGLKLPAQLINLIKEDWSRFQPIDGQYFSKEIMKLLNQPLKPLFPLSFFEIHRQENLQSLQKKISVLLDLKIDFEKQEIIRWVQLCQNGDGGFGFFPGTTSYMENIYCALEILSKLQALPRWIGKCREYILGCQTKSGGFGRALVSFPFIESTFQAVKGLLILEEMEGRSI
ncbi:MAG: prenyltransferase/squalene oxidase repeat-containing protein [Thermodesulfobacteriota bacterium]